MRRLPLYLLALAVVAPALAQSPAEETPDDYAVPGQRLPARVAILPLVQHYTAEAEVAQFGTVSTTGIQASVPITAYVPVGRTWAVGARIAAASGSGDASADATGLSDAQLQVSHFRSLGSASLVASLRANAPTGAQRLSLEEYSALVLLTQDVYGFVSPNLGVGPAIAPGITLAVPLSDDLTAGLGVAYNVRGSFEPLENMPDPYLPGNELLVTGGLDWFLSPTLIASADASVTLYGTDTIAGEDVFDPGSRTVATARLRSSRGRREAEVLVRYFGRGVSRLLATGAGPPAEVRSVPNRLLARASYRAPLGPLSFRPWAEVGAFQESAVVPGSTTILGLGLDAEVPIMRSFSLALYGRGRFGGVMGGEGGLGLTVKL